MREEVLFFFCIFIIGKVGMFIGFRVTRGGGGFERIILGTDRLLILDRRSDFLEIRGLV